MSSDQIKVDHLRYFIAAAETGSFAAAGKKLNITPTSVAYGISVIEDSMGTDLLIRRRASGVAPTRRGEAFIEAARKVLLEIDNLTDEFKESPAKLTGDLFVGCQEGLTWSIAPRVIEEMKRLHPDLRVSIKTIFMDEGFVPLESGAVDLMITFVINEITDPKLYHEVLCQPQAYAMMREGHPVAQKAGSKVSLHDLVEYPHIFIQDGPGFPLFHGMYDERGLKPNTLMVSNISPGAQAVVGKTDAISLRIVRPSIPYSPLGDRLAYIEVKEKVLRPDIVAVTLTSSQSRISRKAKAFIDICRQKFDDGTLRENFFYT